MGDFQRSPSKVWWGNDYSSANCIKLTQQQWHHMSQQPTYSEQEEEQEQGILSVSNLQDCVTYKSPPSINISTVQENSASEWLNRNSSGSPNSHKSQDSGFSDSETSAPNDSDNSGANKNYQYQQNGEINTEMFLKNCSNDQTPIKNYNLNQHKEKYSPKKCILNQINAESCKYRNYSLSAPNSPQQTIKNVHLNQSLPLPNIKSLVIYPHQQNINTQQSNCSESVNSSSENTTPRLNRTVIKNYSNTTGHRFKQSQNTPETYNDIQIKSENSKLQRNSHRSSKSSPRSTVNRKLFSCMPNNSNSLEDISKINDEHIQASQNCLETTPPAEVFFHDVHSINLRHSQTMPCTKISENNSQIRLNVTAPVGNEIQYDANAISFENLDETTLINPPLNMEMIDSPVHHSTPKHTRQVENDCLQRKIFNARLKNQQIETIQQNEQSLIQPSATKPPPSVAKWLEELAKLYEAECMVTLQSKSLAAHLSRQVAESATQATVAIKSLFSHSKIIYSDFYTIRKHLANNKFEHLGPLIQSLNGNITEFILTFVINSQANSLMKTEERNQEVQNILQLCDYLRTASIGDCSLEHLEKTVQQLRTVFIKVERGILAIQMQLLVNIIEEPTTELALRGAIQGVTWVAAQQNITALVQLIQCGTPRALLTVCLESKASTLRAAALRALAAICSTNDAIRQIEQAGGIEIIAEILSESTRPEPELSEAIAVLVQITAPWVEDNHSIKGLKENSKSLIMSLTSFLGKTHCCQNLLLCAAALANISSLESSTIWSLLQCYTAEKLLNAVQKRGPNISVFLKEQVATLLANMSAASESRLQLGEAKAVVALLCFLQMSPSCLDDAIKSAEQASSLRLQQRAAVALSRLCNEKSIAQQVVKLGGVNQIVRLCKEQRERNYSDAVLVACLSTLRKIVSNCGNVVMNEEDILELVQPHLLDSFLTYSSQNESYV